MRWCAAPRRGAALILLSLAAVLLVPFAAAHARHAVLLNRAGSIEDLDTRLAEAERRVAFYRVLRERRWPMTKLIADVAGAAPVGVTLETLELDQAGGASGGGSILIRGQAETTDLVTTFRENLAKTRVFSGLATPTVGATGDSVQFQLQARVTANAAVYPAPPAEDFAAKTLAQRLYEEGAAGLDEADPEADAEEPDAEAASREPAATPRSAPRETRSSRPPARPSQTAAVEIPPPLTDAEIAAMDALKAMSEFAKRRAAAYQRGLDQETVARLTEEADKCQRRMKEARPAQTGGPR